MRAALDTNVLVYAEGVGTASEFQRAASCWMAHSQLTW
jgi:predicted nucleic acid-binding protein